MSNRPANLSSLPSTHTAHLPLRAYLRSTAQAAVVRTRVMATLTRMSQEMSRSRKVPAEVSPTSPMGSRSCLGKERPSQRDTASMIRHLGGIGFIPATDALTRSPERLVEMVFLAFPELEEKLAVGVP